MIINLLTLLRLIVVQICLAANLSHAQEVVSKNSPVSALYYLTKSGWINTNDENSDTAQLLSSDGLKSAIKDFQAFGGLEQTGELDEETVELMNTPRCGVPDKIGHGAWAKRRKRYALQGSRWRTKTLTYRVTKYPSGNKLSRKEVDDTVEQSFRLWAEQTDLTFQQKSSGSVHIEIRFERRSHGDGDPFDGAGGTLAHAYFPQYGGDAHFDDEEIWSLRSFRGTNLLQTAAHEFGHSLGLSHSDDQNALMAPFYRGWQPNLKLARDDIDAIQALYGRKPSKPTTTSSVTTTKKPAVPPTSVAGTGGGGGGGGGTGTNNFDLCRDPNVDTIFNTANGKYYVFKDGDYWLLTDESVADGYPRRIQDDWPGLPDKVDAAVTWPDNEMTFFFAGSQYWKFRNQKPESGYPKQIRSGFRGIPNNLDAAFIWGGNGKIYFFKNSKYWKFDPTRKPPVRSVYPRPISNWDLPSNIRGAVKWSNKYTYFFTNDGSYYRFDDKRFTIDEADPSFPRKTGPWWFGCEGTTAAATKQEEIRNLFDEASETLLDVFAGDEDKK